MPTMPLPDLGSTTPAMADAAVSWFGVLAPAITLMVGLLLAGFVIYWLVGLFFGNSPRFREYDRDTQYRDIFDNSDDDFD